MVPAHMISCCIEPQAVLLDKRATRSIRQPVHRTKDSMGLHLTSPLGRYGTWLNDYILFIALCKCLFTKTMLLPLHTTNIIITYLCSVTVCSAMSAHGLKAHTRWSRSELVGQCQFSPTIALRFPTLGEESNVPPELYIGQIPRYSTANWHRNFWPVWTFLEHVLVKFKATPGVAFK